MASSHQNWFLSRSCCASKSTFYVLRVSRSIRVLEYSQCAIRVYLFGEFYPLFLKKNQAKWRKVLLVVLLLEKEPISNRSPKTEREKCVGVGGRILCALCCSIGGG